MLSKGNKGIKEGCGCISNVISFTTTFSTDLNFSRLLRGGPCIHNKLFCNCLIWHPRDNKSAGFTITKVDANNYTFTAAGTATANTNIGGGSLSAGPVTLTA